MPDKSPEIVAPVKLMEVAGTAVPAEQVSGAVGPVWYATQKAAVFTPPVTQPKVTLFAACVNAVRFVGFGGVEPLEPVPVPVPLPVPVVANLKTQITFPVLVLEAGGSVTGLLIGFGK